ncbi:MAG: hypothetical protein WBW94_05645 [Anaerolineales bacterium]
MKKAEIDERMLALEMQKLLMEENKAWFEFHKHITTVDTGVILIIATLLEKVFVNVDAGSFNFVTLSFCSLLASVIFSVIGLGYHMPSVRIVVIPDNSKSLKRIRFSIKYMKVILMVLSLVCFLMGMAFFVSFTLNVKGI